MKRGLTFYARLLRLYPRSFREEFGDEMRKVFRDQYRAAGEERGRSRLLQFWLQTLWDFLSSLLLQHAEELKTSMNIQSMAMRMNYVRLSLAIAACLTIFCVLVTIFIMPREYEGLARLEIGARSNGEAPFDPYRLQTAMEVLQSQQVLLPVVVEFGLQKRFAQLRGTAGMTESEAIDFLRKSMTVRHSRNTSLFEIRILSQDGRLSAAIANKIADVFSRVRPNYGIQVIDQALPADRAVRPNLMINVVLGALASLAAALVIAAVIQVVLKIAARRSALRA